MADGDGEIDVGKDVAVDDEEGITAEQWQGGGDTSGGFQPLAAFGRVGNVHAVDRTVAKGVFDLLSEPGMVDDDFSESGLLQAAQAPARAASRRYRRT